MSNCYLNHKFLKEKAKPGSWRRGYEVYQKGLVQDVKLTRNVLKSTVKGSYKDHYDVTLKFQKDKITPSCTCPLKEEWCKHVVALGLTAIDNHIYDEYAQKRYKMEIDYSDEQTTPIANPQGSYIFHFNPKRKQNFFSILVMERETGKVVRDLEGLFKKIIARQKQGEDIELTYAQKVNIELFKMLLTLSRLDKKAGWYDVPILKFDPFFKMLSKAEEVIDGKTKSRIRFTSDVWTLGIGVNFSMVGNVLVSLYWKRPDRDDILPFEEVRYFSRQLQWGRYKNIIFPTNIAVSSLPQNLIKSSFTDIKDAEGAKFIYEELPKLKQITEVETTEVIDKLSLEESHPINVVTLGLDYDGSLKASLEFDYNGTRVPYSKNDKTPYVTVKKPKEDLLYYVKRNKVHEEQAYQMLLNCKFAPMQTNNLGMGKENAIDFYNYYISKAGEGWIFEEKDNMIFFKLAPTPFELCANLDFCEEKDSFSIELYGKIDEEIISFNDVYEIVLEGDKYYKVKGQGFVELPITEIFSLMKSFNTIDVYRNEENKYVVKSYRAGIVSEMQNLNMTLKMSRRFSKFWKQISTFSQMDGVALPKGINAELREYQAKGFSWLWFLYQYGLNGILADDMGLGKTLQALSLIQKAKEKDKHAPNLVICPTSVVFNWESEIQKFAPKMKCLKLSGTERKEYFKDIDKYDVIITSYALVRRDIEELEKHNFRYIILDESQNIKNAGSLTAKSVKKLKSTHKLALSGTPIENRLEELWSVFDFLMPGFLFEENEFNYRYVAPITERSDKTVERRLKSQIYPFILRRMKRDVAKDLPDKVESIAYCELTPEQKDFYLDVLDSTKEELFKSIEQNGLEKSRLSIFSALLRLRQICCHPRLYDKEGKRGEIHSGKFEQLKVMLEQIIEEKHRVLLFSQFVDMLDIIKKWLEKEGIKHEYLTGKTKDRGAVVERFNNDTTIPIFLISLKAGGTGLNLTGADYVIHYDPWWNPAVEDQATDRAYRIGQTKKVFVYRIITKGTVEEKIQRLKIQKRNLVDSVISVDRNIGKSLSYADLQDIFSLD
jgi:non-specific serine/threonine protein kinase